jgi:two-component system, OmpR family, sensor histidine kinase KdpD
VIADAALLTRILTSLVADALHRSPGGAPPALTAAITGSNVTICVTDHGPRPDQGNSDGDGLALRLARDLAEAMGDTLRCDQAPDGGRSTAITLPAANRPRAHPVPAHPRNQLPAG